ncbi:MAG: ATPase domain-containing protein [Candidatus Acidiferrales bacterium]
MAIPHKSSCFHPSSGGLPKGRTTIVCGGPGCGKTMLGLEFLERGDEIEFTAASYIRAVRSYVCLTDSTQWVEPATRSIVSSGDSSIVSQPAPRRRRPGSVRVPPANSIRPRPRLEITVTRTKQRKETGSNRP